MTVFSSHLFGLWKTSGREGGRSIPHHPAASDRGRVAGEKVKTLSIFTAAMPRLDQRRAGPDQKLQGILTRYPGVLERSDGQLH